MPVHPAIEEDEEALALSEGEEEEFDVAFEEELTLVVEGEEEELELREEDTDDVEEEDEIPFDEDDEVIDRLERDEDALAVDDVLATDPADDDGAAL